MTIVCASVTQTRPGTGEKGQAAKSKTFEVSKPFLWAKDGRNRRSVKFASKRSVSVYRGFPSRCTLNCNRIEPAAKKKGKERLIAGLTIGRRKLQLVCKFCFVFQPSFADKFSVSWAFFLHEQCVSLRLALSVLSDIIISRNELSFYFIYLFIYLFHFHCISFVPKK